MNESQQLSKKRSRIANASNKNELFQGNNSEVLSIMTIQHEGLYLMNPDEARGTITFAIWPHGPWTVNQLMYLSIVHDKLVGIGQKQTSTVNVI